MIPNEIFCNGTDIVKEFGIPLRTLQNWTKSGHITQNEKGKYSLLNFAIYRNKKLQAEIVKHKDQCRKLKEEIENSKFNNNEDVQEIRRRKLLAETEKEKQTARIKKLQADQLEGTLVSAEDVLTEWRNYINNTKAKLITIPTKLAYELSGISDPDGVRKILEKSIDEALLEMGREAIE